MDKSDSEKNERVENLNVDTQENDHWQSLR